MAKRFAVRPVEPLILEFADGTVKEAALTNEALMILFEEFGDLGDLLESEMTKPMDFAAKILYAAMKVMDTTVTLEMAKTVVLGGGVELMMQVYDMFSDNLGTMSEDELKKNLTPIVNKYLKKLRQ